MRADADRPGPADPRLATLRAATAILALGGAACLLAAPLRALADCPPNAALTPIAEVQGSGGRSPLAGHQVTVEGVVTAAFQGTGGLDGLFLQDPVGDGNPDTSEGLFVALPKGAVAPEQGTVARVAGRVSEARTLTQLTSVSSLTACGTASVPPAERVTLPVGDAGWEALEGMRVRVAGPLTVNDVYDLGRYGELTIAEGRRFAATQGVPDGGAGTLGGIVLDDGSRVRQPRPVPYLRQDGSLPRDGDTVAGVEGVVAAVAANVHAIEPTVPIRVEASNPRPASPAAVGGTLRIATLNAHNFFTTLGDRGARTPQTYALQRDKLVSALAGLDADALVLEEIEANGMTSEDVLLRALNARLGGDVYAAVPDPNAGVGRDRIKQAVLYKPTALTLVARASDPRPIFERAPIAATFEDGDGNRLTLIAVHLKSKGGCPTAGDIDMGYGCWNLRRSAQAQAVLDFAAARAHAVGSPDVLVAGDMNSYAAEPPLLRFAREGYRDAGAGLPAAERYSYVYFGAAGTLDYALLSPSLAGRLSGATYWHIDADESPLLGAGGGLTAGEAAAAVGAGAPSSAQGTGPGATPFRASDHDPLLLGLSTAP